MNEPSKSLFAGDGAPRLLGPLLILMALMTLMLVSLGGYVRATGAGLSCPDWPLCFGRAVPHDFGSGVAQEVIHRYFASGVFLLTSVLTVMAFRVRRSVLWPWRLACLLMVLLVIQIVLGGLTVLVRLNPFIVTAHLMLGTLFFQIIVATLSRPKAAPLASASSVEPAVTRNLRRSFALLIGLIFFQIILGGFVGASGASMACPEVPWCTGPHSGPRDTQMLHRLTGTAILFVSLLVAAFAFIKRAQLPVKLPSVIALFGLVAVQVTIGFANVIYSIPVSMTVVHLIVAQIILAHAVAVYQRICRVPVFAGTLYGAKGRQPSDTYARSQMM